MEYTNIYRHCGEVWESLADSMCNDRCPTCNKEIEPAYSNDQTLKQYSVSFYEDKGDQHFQIFQCQAEDEDHAEEQTENAYPNCEIRSIFLTE